MVKIAQIGNGKAAVIHRLNLPKNSQVLALVVRNIAKNIQLTKTDPTLPKNVFITNDISAVYKKFDNLIWDIVSDDESHFDFVSKILKHDSKAKIMLGKTPYNRQLISDFENLLKKYPNSKLTIVENYAVSAVTATVAKLIQKYQLKPAKITLEFTKNRAADIEKGRFVHQPTGVLGYEGSHMLTVLANLIERPIKIISGKCEDLVLSDGKVLKNQGSGFFQGTADDCQIIFYTSMNGKVMNKLSELGVVSDIGYGSQTRYRVVIVEDGVGKKIIGQYDPVLGFKKLYGRVLVIEDDKIVETVSNIPDNTMERILKQQIDFLSGRTSRNPMPIAVAKNFSVLEEVFEKYKS